MPTVGLDRDDLFKHLGKSYTQEEFDELCFEFGVELDEVTSDAAVEAKMRGEEVTEEHMKEGVVYKIDVPANRYDLLCMEGIARSLRIFLGLEAPPVYKVPEWSDGMHTMVVKPSTGAIRPFVVCAVLRGMTFNEKVYKSFIDLQDKLHQNICRRRTLVAIGTHDLSTLKGPFRYEAKAPSSIEFVPLSWSKSIKSDALMEAYRTDATYKHIKPYVDIIADSPVYPIIYDSNDVVLSLPPIINGEHSKITEATRDVFIECTATDLTKANIVLNTMVTMFAGYCAEPFAVEPVRVVYEADGSSYVTPDLSSRAASADVDAINTICGVTIEPPEICRLLNKMQLPASYSVDDNKVTVQVPPTRSDVLHQCDIIEDVAIAYGFNKIPRRLPKCVTVGQQQPMNHLTDLLRVEVALAGYTEILSLALCSEDEAFKMLRRKDERADGGGRTSVRLDNPTTIEYEIARTTLLPGLLKTLRENRSLSVKEGLKLFEISDVVTIADDTDVGARNTRHLAAVYTGPTSGFEIIHGLVDKIMMLLGVEPCHIAEPEGADAAGAGGGAASAAGGAGSGEAAASPRKKKAGDASGMTYGIYPSTDPTLFPGHAARIVVYGPGAEKGLEVGTFGTVHPEVLSNFELVYPASIVEMTLEPFL